MELQTFVLVLLETFTYCRIIFLLRIHTNNNQIIHKRSILYGQRNERCLSANFGCDESEFDSIPDKEVYIVDGGDPGPIESQTVDSPYGKVPNTFKHELINVKPRQYEGGTIRILDHENFPACTTIAAALVEVEPGAMREIHWHSNNDELQYYIQGEECDEGKLWHC